MVKSFINGLQEFLMKKLSLKGLLELNLEHIRSRLTILYRHHHYDLHILMVIVNILHFSLSSYNQSLIADHISLR
jgi:hypothetical protein